MGLTAAELRGYAVHLYTASSLVFVVMGMQWVLDGRYAWALVAMAVTIVIDATDGALAREVRIVERAPGIDGELLDNVVDFTSYALLPVLFLMHADLLLAPSALFGVLIMISAAYGFSRTSAKLADQGFFVGFPSYWNVAAFYLYLLQWPAWANTLIVLALVALAFTSVRFLYISRLKRWRTLHFLLGGAWGVACLVALWLEPGPLRLVLVYGSFLYVAFYVLHSFALGGRERRGGAS